MSITAVQAVAAVAGDLGERGARHVATQVGGTDLWSVQTFDESSELPEVGASVLVGPDSRVWVFSSNPGIHDWGLAVATLSAIYREGVASVVEQDALAAAVQVATEERQRQVQRIVAEAVAGNLRARPQKSLP